MNERDKDQPEEVDPPAWALAATGLPLEEMEEYLPPTDPYISVVAGSQPTKSEFPKGVAVEAETETVVDQIARFIERFVFLKTKSLYRLLALWTISTHMQAEFEYTGYIFACSPEPQSGKSRLLEILELLVAYSSGILISPSEAVLFRTAHGHTQLLDEVDGWTNREFLRSVLNAGFRRGATVKRVEDGSSGYEIGSFLVFAPRALAGIGSKILDGTTRDRTFQFEMVRQMRDERRAKFRARTAGPEAKLITSEVGENRDSLDVSAVLRRFGFETKSIRKGGEAKYRYSLPHSALKEITKRYGGAEKPSDEDQEAAVVSVVSVAGEGEGEANEV